MNIQKIGFNNFATTFSTNNSMRKDGNTIENKSLEYTPATDTVSFKGKDVEVEKEFKNYSCKDADMLKYDLDYSKPSFFNRGYEIVGDNVELVVKNKLGGAQNVSGEAFESTINVTIDSGIFGIRKGTVKGVIGDKEIEAEYRANENSKNIKIKGDIEHFDEKEKALILMLISDKIKYDIRAEQELEMIAIASTLG